jgi:hypothetical protein
MLCCWSCHVGSILPVASNRRDALRFPALRCPSGFQGQALGVAWSLLFDVFVDAVECQIHVEAVQADRTFGNRFVHPIGFGAAVDVELPVIQRYENIFAQAGQSTSIGIELFSTVDALGDFRVHFDDQAGASDRVVFAVLRVADEDEVLVVEGPICLCRVSCG